MIITRGTTPTHTFTLKGSLTASLIGRLYVTYKQGEKIVVDKAKSDCTIAGVTGGVSVAVKLTQLETLAFKEQPGKVQIRFVTSDNNAMVTDEIPFAVEGILKDGEI